MPEITAHQFAAVLAHLGASKFAEQGIAAPTSEAVAVAVLESTGVRVVVSITAYNGPALIDPSVVEKIAVFQASQEAPKCPLEVETSAPVLSAMQRRVLDVLDSETVGRKGTWIAAKLGASYGGGFRQSLADLLKMGLLERDSRGYRTKPRTS